MIRKAVALPAFICIDEKHKWLAGIVSILQGACWASGQQNDFGESVMVLFVMCHHFLKYVKYSDKFPHP